MSTEEMQEEQDGAPPVEKRKCGAQPGNFNALKHGFYSRRYREQEKLDLFDGKATNEVQDEITLFKVLIRRVFDHANEAEDNLENWTYALSTCGVGMMQMASLLRAQAKVKDDQSDIASAISQAISEVTCEFDSK